MSVEPLFDDLSVIVLAGGKGARLNGCNKGLINLDGKRLIDIVIDKLQQQLSNIVISANDELKTYNQLGYPVVSDTTGPGEGPVAGILSCRSHIHTPLTLLLPVDAPLFPMDYPKKMRNYFNKFNATCIAHDGIRAQYLFTLFETRLYPQLADYFKHGNRSIKHWLLGQSHKFVDFSDDADAFLNINSPEDLQRLQQRWQAN